MKLSKIDIKHNHDSKPKDKCFCTNQNIVKPEACSLKSEWLNSVEAAAYLKLSVGQLRNMTSNGQVPFYKLGRRNRYRTEELRKLLLSEKRGVKYGN